MLRVVTVVCITALIALPSGAQTPPVTSGTGAESCADLLQPSMAYGRCALWLDGHRLRRGYAGAIVARTGFFGGPMRLEANVIGDSARAHARLYARDVRRASALSAAATLLYVAAVLVAESTECDRHPTLGYCKESDDGHTVATASLLASGLVVMAASIPFTIGARRHAARAILWHNERFTR